jgi:hypothetical protein
MERQQEAFAAVKTDWAKATKDDPEIGGKNMKATIDNVAKALDFLGHPSVKDKDGNETDPFVSWLTIPALEIIPSSSARSPKSARW